MSQLPPPYPTIVPSPMSSKAGPLSPTLGLYSVEGPWQASPVQKGPWVAPWSRQDSCLPTHPASSKVVLAGSKGVLCLGPSGVSCLSRSWFFRCGGFQQRGPAWER